MRVCYIKGLFDTSSVSDDRKLKAQRCVHRMPLNFDGDAILLCLLMY